MLDLKTCERAVPRSSQQVAPLAQVAPGTAAKGGAVARSAWLWAALD